MNHLEASATTFVPQDMYLGNISSLSPNCRVAYFYGSKGAWSPGWYLLGEFAAKNNLPLDGPFDTEEAATYAFHQSERAFFAREIRNKSMNRPDAGRFAYVAQSSLIFEPTVILRPEALVMGSRSRVDSFCKLECGEGLYLGAYVHIASFVHLGIGGGTVIFEEGASAASGSRVLSGSAGFDGPSWSATHPYVVNTKTTTRIRKNATVLTNAVVLPGCDIGEGATIAAGAVVLANTRVQAGEVWAGIPARKLIRTGRTS